jgi:hypothetical protein
MSVSTLRGATANLNRTTANFARKHSRASLIAGSAAAVGVLGAAGFSVGAAPWAQAIDNVAKTAQSDLPSASSRPVTNLFAPITDAKPANGKPLASGPLDTIRSAATAGGTNGTATVGHAVAKDQATAGAAPYAPKHAAKQPAKPQAAHAAAKPAAKAPAAPHVAKHRAAKPKAHAAPAQPYTIYDSVKPGAIPNGKAAAVYVNGAYAASAAQVAGYGSVLWIDTNGSDPAANVLDVEPGDATPAGAAQWAKQRLSSRPHSVAIIYTMMNDWQQVKDNVAALPGWMQSKVRYWIADPTGVPHVVAGANATQWYWGNSYDVTTANPDFVN